MGAISVLVLIEEWIWNILSRFGLELIQRLNLLSLETWLLKQEPNTILLSLASPLLFVLAANLMALRLVAKGQALEGLAILITVKLLATLLIAHFFKITRPNLREITWFAQIDTKLTAWITWAHIRIHRSAAYHYLVGLKTKMLSNLRRR